MHWILAASAGAGLGFAYFGGLWLTVATVVRTPSRASWIPLSGVARLALVGVGFAVLGRRGAGSILAALVGLWLSRSYLIHRLGGVHRGN